MWRAWGRSDIFVPFVAFWIIFTEVGKKLYWFILKDWSFFIPVYVYSILFQSDAYMRQWSVSSLAYRLFGTKLLSELHNADVIMIEMASQVTSLAIVYSIVYSDADRRKHQSSASLAFVRGIHWGPVNSPHKWPVTRKMFPFDDVIMNYDYLTIGLYGTNFR